MSKLKVGFVLLFVFISAVLSADEFDMKDPKGVNSILFSLDAPLEMINGSGSDLSGKVNFDPADAKSLKGEIVLKVDSLKATNATMTEHLHGAKWLDKEKNPEIKVEFVSVENAEKTGEEHILKVNVKVSIKGISKEQSIVVKVTHLPGKLGDRVNGKKGDLLALRSVFTVKRSEFDLQAGMHTDKVAEDITVTALLTGHKFN